MAVSHVDHFECSFDEIPAIVSAHIGIPFVGDQSHTKMLGEPSDNKIFLYQSAIQIHTGEYTLIILKPCDDSAIVIWVHFVSLLVTDVSQIIH